MRAPRRPMAVVLSWVRRQPPKVKAFLAVVAGMTALVFIRFIVHDHDNLFVAAEAAHALGIAVLIYKLTKEKTCAAALAELETEAIAAPSSFFQTLFECSDHVSVSSPDTRYKENFHAQALKNLYTTVHMYNLYGLSLKSQDLTALFLAVRLYCSFVMEYDIHTILDSATLVATLFVIYMIRFRLRSTYMLDKDNFALYYVDLLGLLCLLGSCFSAAPVALDAEYKAHYVFALGVARFLSCAHWVLQVLDTRGRLLTALGYGFWPSMVLLSEIVQTFILADFCYYYVKSFKHWAGQGSS
uniref:ER lumen protein retaining receptor n=1 Tax=Aegilops tauschii TaxID=37682 RepID=M8BDZ5_AEGTA